MTHRRHPLAAALLLAAALSAAPAQATISLAVGAGGQSAEGTFGAGVTRVHGRALDAAAFVDTGPSPCLKAGSCVVLNANAVTNADFDAEQARWRVEGYATGANTGTAVELLVTDLLSLTGTPNTMAMLTFNVRVEIDDLYASPFGDGIGADTWYAYELGSMTSIEGPPQFQPFFSVTAESHHYAGFPPQTIFNSPDGEGSEIPKVYEKTFSMPVFLGPTGTSDLDIALRSHAETAVQDGRAGVNSFNSAYLGLSATGAVLTSAHGYGYLGYTAAPIPEPATWWMALAGLAALGVARRRQAARATAGTARGA